MKGVIVLECDWPEDVSIQETVQRLQNNVPHAEKAYMAIKESAQEVLDTVHSWDQKGRKKRCGWPEA